MTKQTKKPVRSKTRQAAVKKLTRSKSNMVSTGMLFDRSVTPNKLAPAVTENFRQMAVDLVEQEFLNQTENSHPKNDRLRKYVHWEIMQYVSKMEYVRENNITKKSWIAIATIFGFGAVTGAFITHLIG